MNIHDEPYGPDLRSASALTMERDSDADAARNIWVVCMAFMPLHASIALSSHARSRPIRLLNADAASSTPEGSSVLHKLGQASISLPPELKPTTAFTSGNVPPLCLSDQGLQKAILPT
jgi:hypothetical protein